MLVLRSADKVLCSLAPREGRQDERLPEGQAPWLCFSVWNAHRPPDNWVAVLCCVFAQVSKLSHSFYCWPLQECSPLASLCFSSKGSAHHSLIPPFFGLSPTVIPDRKVVYVAPQLFSLLASPVCPLLDVSMQGSLVCAGNLYWVIALQIVPSSREIKGGSHTTIPLTSLQKMYIFVHLY